ncbi:MAG: MFS transporter [Gammaproteobacteria bacterium]
MNQNEKKNLFAWCLYDWASSAFPIIITTFIFATYFTSHIAENEIRGTYLWANATAIAGIIIAIGGPIVGAIADYRGHHKRWLLVFTLLCVGCSALLWYAYPSPNYANYTLIWVILGTISLEIAIIFYNSFLPHIAPPDYLGRISGWAWGSGYLGGIIALCIALFGFIKATPSWLNTDTAAQVRICGPMVAIWFVLFSLPLFICVPDTPLTGKSFSEAIRQGLKELVQTLKRLPAQKNLMLYLIAHLIYADGLNTLFAFGGIYAAGTFKMDLSLVILFGITMNLSAGLGAIAFAWLDDWLGSKPTIIASLISMIIFGIPVLLVEHRYAFWGCALVLALFLGTVQASSRSLMARLVPIEKSTEMFGLYAFSGKITAFMGPWLLGLATFYFHSQRAGMATILIFFIVGAFLMYFVRENPETTI